MMKNFTCLLFLVTVIFAATAQEKFQLAPPMIKYRSVFFTDEARVILAFAQPGAIIHYTTHAEEPDENSPVYLKPVIIKNNFTTLKAKVFGKSFLPSETVQATFLKDGLPVQKIEFPVPDIKYSGEGPNTLMDNKGGISNYSNSTWLGFKQDTVTITITLIKKSETRSILFNLLQDQGSWIFFPYKAEAFSIDTTNAGVVKLGEMFFNPKENTEVSICRPYVINFKKKIKTSTITLQLYLLKNIPDWHPGKGQSSWIFIDEVKLY